MISLFPSRQVFLSIGPLSVHWYGVMYALAFIIGSSILPYLLPLRKLELDSSKRESLLFHVFLGVVVGGRIGYCLLYGASYYFSHPLSILAVWEGGMSSHGGFIGVTMALLHFAKKNQINLSALADVLMVPVAIGLMLGRFGNLINGELYGTLTTVSWGMHFPGVDGLRHPTQVYAILKDVFLAIFCFIYLLKTSQNFVPGRTASYFLLFYGFLRFVVEFFRDQPFGYVSLGVTSVSFGQLYTLPLIACGGILFLYTIFSGRHHSP